MTFYNIIIYACIAVAATVRRSIWTTVGEVGRAATLVTNKDSARV